MFYIEKYSRAKNDSGQAGMTSLILQSLLLISSLSALSPIYCLLSTD
jgi:hypothetical protein